MNIKKKKKTFQSQFSGKVFGLYILEIFPISVNLEWTLMLEEMSSLLIYIELAAKLVRSKKTQGPIHETVT